MISRQRFGFLNGFGEGSFFEAFLEITGLAQSALAFSFYG